MSAETKPSKDQIVSWYKEQIEIATLRRDLTALQAEIAKNEAQRVQATVLMAQMQNPAASANEVEHIVTQEDLDNNPELAENGVKVGDKILVSNGSSPEPPVEKEEKKLKK